MAKKKSKGFIVPSINFITMRKAEKPKISVHSTISDTSRVSEKVKTVKTPIESAPATDKIEKPAPLDVSRNGRRKSALSLSSLKRKKEEEEAIRRKQENQGEKKNLPKEDFSEAHFYTVWQEYIDDLHKSGEKILASILMADKPRIKDQMIHVTYPNELMKKELLRVRPKVLRTIREKLNNHRVDFVIDVKEENVKRFAYTPQEKYDLLKEKNKDLAFLRKTFNLEL